MRVMTKERLIDFLQTELAVPDAAIAFAQRQAEQDPSLLPLTLWQYGLVTLDQLNQIFDWLDIL